MPDAALRDELPEAGDVVAKALFTTAGGSAQRRT